MFKFLAQVLKKSRDALGGWSRRNLLNLFVFNLVVLLMVLLNSAGYFRPFFFLSINRIFFLSLILAIFLLKVRQKAFFAVAIVFFLFAVFLKIVRIDVWADRSAIYAYQSLVLGVVLLSVNILLYNKKGKN